MDSIEVAQEAQISALSGRVDALEKALAELKGFIDGLRQAPHRDFDHRD